MKTFIHVLTHHPVTEKEAETALTELREWVLLEFRERELKNMKEEILPLKTDVIGVRAEIKILAEQMKTGFEKMDKKMDLVRENLEKQIQSNKESLEKQIQANEKLILATKDNLEKQIKFGQSILWIVLGVVVTSFLKSLF